MNSPLKLSGAIEAETASRYFFYVAIFNVLIAAGATTPILLPQLGLPLVLQIWPGTWMLIAYFSFLIAGVAGVFVWSAMYYMLPRLFGRMSVSRPLSLIHLILFEVGVVGSTGLMGLFPGYTGGTLMHNGFGQFIVTRIIEWTVIPIGIFIGIAIIATLTGIANVILNLTSP